MGLICTAQALSTLAAPINALTLREKKAARIMYKYRAKNTDTVGQVMPAAKLLKDASCIVCDTGRINSQDGLIESFKVVIARNAAIDAGAAEPAINYNSIRKQITPLVNLTESQLNAIETYLDCLAS